MSHHFGIPALAIALLAHAAPLAAQAPADRLALRWGLAPPILPPGARLADVSGDPTQPGWSTIELIMPDGYRMPPHSHPVDEFVEEKDGALLIGIGVRFIGPYTITYLNAHEAPRRPSFPFGY